MGFVGVMMVWDIRVIFFFGYRVVFHLTCWDLQPPPMTPTSFTPPCALLVGPIMLDTYYRPSISWKRTDRNRTHITDK